MTPALGLAWPGPGPQPEVGESEFDAASGKLRGQAVEQCPDGRCRGGCGPRDQPRVGLDLCRAQLGEHNGPGPVALSVREVVAADARAGGWLAPRPDAGTRRLGPDHEVVHAGAGEPVQQHPIGFGRLCRDNEEGVGREEVGAGGDLPGTQPRHQ